MNYADSSLPAPAPATPKAAGSSPRQPGQITLQKQDRSSNYNSMQLTASKRYSHGFTVSTGYTLSKAVGNFFGATANGAAS
jgi:hypothetical protein